MAIPCPGCGREYDVTLFQFGRTVSCTCGSRVGLERRIRSPGAPGEEGDPGPTGVRRPGEDPRTRSPPRFLADAMLGRLARWLRALGYDTAYDPDIEDEAAVRRALEEGRILLTRDRKLPEEWWVEGILVLASGRVEDQLVHLRDRLGIGLRDELLFTRCLRCNTPLEPLASEDAARRVPPRVFKAHETFRRCPACDRIYWRGSHTERMRRRFRALLEAAQGGA